MNKKNRDLLLAVIVIVLIGWLIARYAFTSDEQAAAVRPAVQQEKAAAQ